MAADIRVRRVYDEPGPGDGARVLVDRVWPRGVSRAHAKLDEWARDLAPSTALRAWYGHDPAKFSEFRRRYITELDAPMPRSKLAEVHELAAGRPVTLLTATRDIRISQAAVLAELLSAEDGEEGGDPACWASLVCTECGAVITEGHRKDCLRTTGSA
jgi:uncharacterized protein YeaO (DUF488 family)